MLLRFELMLGALLIRLLAGRLLLALRLQLQFTLGAILLCLALAHHPFLLCLLIAPGAFDLLLCRLRRRPPRAHWRRNLCREWWYRDLRQGRRLGPSRGSSRMLRPALPRPGRRRDDLGARQLGLTDWLPVSMCRAAAAEVVNS